MSQQPEVTFPRRLSTLKEIVENKQREFPIVVKTRNKMVSYQQLPIEEEGKLLFVEQEMEIPYARIKVLKFHDEDEILSARGAELVASYHSFIDEEFYIPTGCDGKLKIVKYPGKRSRYMSVTQVSQS